MVEKQAVSSEDSVYAGHRDATVVWGLPLISRVPKSTHSTLCSRRRVASLTWMHMGKPLDSMRDAGGGGAAGRVKRDSEEGTWEGRPSGI